MTTRQRLSVATLKDLPENVDRPAYDRDHHGAGIVHIGVGAFHKAHQAIYTDRVLASSGGNWMISGVSLRSPRAREELAPQDHLYTLSVRDGDGEVLQVVGALKDVRVAAENMNAALGLLAQPDIHVVTLTVTEKGYCFCPDTGQLDLTNTDVAHDLKHPEAPKTAVGFVAAGLMRRAESGGSPITVISCDNLRHNGKCVENAVLLFLERTSPETLKWCQRNARFPMSVVDRIVPATTAQDRDEIAEKLTVWDSACVKTEPFCQWIIEDNFAGPVPDWADAGALIVPDVEPYELAKLWLLNGAHSAIAYLGSLAGHELVHEAMADGALAAFIRKLMEQEIAPMVPAPQGFDVAGYTSSLRARFANPALRHRTQQIAADGSQKLPQRILPVIRKRLDQGLSCDALATVIASWMIFVSRRGTKGAATVVEDPMAEQLARVVAATSDTNTLLDNFLKLEDVFGDDLRCNSEFRRAVSASLGRLLPIPHRAI